MGYDSFSIGNIGMGQGAQKRLVVLLAMLAMVFHVITPLTTSLSMSRADGLFTTIICSGGEAKEVTFDKNGKPVHQAPSKEHSDCSNCIHHCGLALLTVITALPPVQFAPQNQPLHVAALIAALIGTANSRAPPL